ncbi:hypothetical protein [Kitasatospora sp. NPDC088346]|uniref:hypothetical protein n=1 Tax=Kitasatospora sp. NPDC088346 TaxID=3364073 RepID=UPI00380C24B9
MTRYVIFMNGDPVREALLDCLQVLSPLTADRDWNGPAGPLEWSCRDTAVHIAHELLAYAGQLAARPRDHYLPMDLVVRPEADPAQVLSVVTAAGGLLAHTLDGTMDDVRVPGRYLEEVRQGFEVALGRVAAPPGAQLPDTGGREGLPGRLPARPCDLFVAVRLATRPEDRPEELLDAVREGVRCAWPVCRHWAPLRSSACRTPSRSFISAVIMVA